MALRRPDLADRPWLTRTPPATPTTPVTATFLGVTTVVIDDGTSAIMTDGFFSRPSLWRSALTRLRSHPHRIEEALRRADVRSVDAVVCGHSHFDHALDSAAVAARTGADLIGSESTANIGRGAALPAERIRVVRQGEVLAVGSFLLQFFESEHSLPDRARGVVDQPLPQPARVRQYRCGTTWSIHVTHMPTGHTALLHSSAGYRASTLAGRRADVVYLSIGQLAAQGTAFAEHYWEQTVAAVGARRVILTHWDNFFRPLTAPLRTFPRVIDDVDAAAERLATFAARDGVRLDLPTLWDRTDPWS